MNVYLILFIQVFIAGGTHVVAKAVVNDIDAVTLTFIRSLVSSAGLLAIFVVKEGRLKIEKGDWRKIVLLGFLGLPVNQYLYLYGMKFTTPANGALLYAATPVLVLVLSYFMLGERVTVQKTIGILLAFAGIVLVIFERGIDLSSSYAYGNVIILLAVLAWAFFTILGKPMIVKYGAFHTTSVAMIAGMFLFAPVGLVFSWDYPLSTITLSHWAGILYLGIGTSILGYVLWYYALGKIETSKAAVFANGQPIVATLMAIAFFDYSLTIPFVIGGVITIVGVVLTQLG
ncbi:MAG TPA: DMT family transporter [Bacteroidota bacterium]|nr:DMT family transporter [Bacteroidota bacterium]